ncbi:heavy metal-associated isoprenylated plant protein 21-like [Andrographis paniculata]|uniref:heavy metal-associated isoprenylated plant protein 21-like n=1 Tax=Andrographis paniculata TaxID=175694 RepID=UPI0021E98C4F|nr:heavy metal-associated isoprenylated plant protein 21-like [Andrographis paniculata]
MGAVQECVSSLCLCMFTTTTTKSKRRSMQTVEIKVKMDCDGCERRVKNAIKNLKGVKSIEVNRKQSQVTVTGCIDPNKVLKSVKNTGKRAELWPYVPYNVVQYPQSFAQAYDKRAPAGYVKNVQPQPQAATTAEETITYLFSDENTNAACSIM